LNYVSLKKNKKTR